jgi:two-component system invasion response regulator UvrY
MGGNYPVQLALYVNILTTLQGWGLGVMINILIVDDHTIVRKGLSQILSDTEDLRVAGEAENGMQAIKMIQDNNYDVVLLDIILPDKHGIDVLNQIKLNKPQQAVLMLSSYPEDQYALRSLKAGASGYINKQSPPPQLLAAIRQVATGKKYISESLAEELANGLSQDHHELPHQTLSNREYQTLCLIASGKKLSEIAATMSLSAKTVSVYRARLMEKMHLKSNAEMVHYAITHHLID